MPHGHRTAPAATVFVPSPVKALSADKLAILKRCESYISENQGHRDRDVLRLAKLRFVKLLQASILNERLREEPLSIALEYAQGKFEAILEIQALAIALSKSPPMQLITAGTSKDEVVSIIAACKDKPAISPTGKTGSRSPSP